MASTVAVIHIHHLVVPILSMNLVSKCIPMNVIATFWYISKYVHTICPYSLQEWVPIDLIQLTFSDMCNPYLYSSVIIPIPVGYFEFSNQVTCHYTNKLNPSKDSVVCP